MASFLPEITLIRYEKGDLTMTSKNEKYVFECGIGTPLQLDNTSTVRILGCAKVLTEPLVAPLLFNGRLTISQQPSGLGIYVLDEEATLIIHNKFIQVGIHTISKEGFAVLSQPGLVCYTLNDGTVTLRLAHQGVVELYQYDKLMANFRPGKETCESSWLTAPLPHFLLKPLMIWYKHLCFRWINRGGVYRRLYGR